jgi:hypothetical protein
MLKSIKNFWLIIETPPDNAERLAFEPITENPASGPDIPPILREHSVIY